MRVFRISREELQEMLDKAADQAVSQGVALAQQLIRTWWDRTLRDAGAAFLRFLWKPLALLIAGVAIWVVYILRDYL